VNLEKGLQVIKKGVISWRGGFGVAKSYPDEITRKGGAAREVLNMVLGEGCLGECLFVVPSRTRREKKEQGKPNKKISPRRTLVDGGPLAKDLVAAGGGGAGLVLTQGAPLRKKGMSY